MKPYKKLNIAWSFLLVTVFAAVGSMSVEAQQGDAALHIAPEVVEINYGDSAELMLMLDGVANAYGIDVQMSFDPAVMQIVDADPNVEGVQIIPGQFIKPDFVVLNTVDNQTGVLRYAVTQVNPTPVASGSGVLLSFQLRGVGSDAETALTFDRVEMASPDGFLLPVQQETGIVRVAESTAAALTIPTATPLRGATQTPTLSPASAATSTPAPSADATATTVATATLVAPGSNANETTPESAEAGQTPQLAPASSQDNDVTPVPNSAASSASQPAATTAAESEQSVASAEVSVADAFAVSEATPTRAVIGGNSSAEVKTDALPDAPDQTGTVETSLVPLAGGILILIAIVAGLLVLLQRRRT